MGYAASAWREDTAFLVREVADAPYGAAAGPAEEAGPAGEADPDLLDDLADEIATLAAHIHAATHRMLVLLARFDRLRGWEASGQRSCAHWLAFRTGYDLGTAREHVRVARALEELPRTGEAMSRGRLSFSQVRALTRVAEAANEADLLELAEGATTAQLERVVRAWKKGSRKDEAAWERERHLSRKLSIFPDEDGMYVVQGRLDPEVGALLMRAVEAASDALYRDRFLEAVREQAPELARGPEAEREAARRRADAMGLLAERALTAGFGGGGDGGDLRGGSEGSGAENGSNGTRATDPESEPGSEVEPSRAACDCGGPRAEAAAAPEVPISGTRAERYQVMLHVDAQTLSADGEPGRSELEDGTRVSAETSRRLSCDAGLVTVTRGPDGSVLDVGRRTRTIPPALRRALEVRDRGCRFPDHSPAASGARGLRFTDAHHLLHWADGGKTRLDNTLLLCSYHHRLVHEGGWRVQWWREGRLTFLDPRGQQSLDASRPPPTLPRDPVKALVRRNRLRGTEPDGWTAGARWKWERDIPDEVQFRATQAL